MSINYPPEWYLRRTLAGAGLLFRLAVLAAAAAFATQVMAAQVQPPANSSAPTTAKKSPRHRAQAAEVPPEPEATAPAQPEAPKWPVNEKPNKASVTWDSHGLRIAASNASLHQILNEVAAETGAKVEGLGSDERVFGEYGPGQARDVISQLLHGSSYNVLMIGDQGSGTPREIVLSNRHAGKNPATANQNQNEPNQDTGDEDYSEQPEVDEQPPPQPQMMNGGQPPMPMVPQGPPGAPRTPQQVLQELQQRQQQIQDQQQQQQQQQQQPPQ